MDAQSNSEDGQCAAPSAGRCQGLRALTPLSKRQVTGREVGGQAPGVGAGAVLHEQELEGISRGALTLLGTDSDDASMNLYVCCNSQNCPSTSTHFTGGEF